MRTRRGIESIRAVWTSSCRASVELAPKLRFTKLSHKALCLHTAIELAILLRPTNSPATLCKVDALHTDNVLYTAVKRICNVYCGKIVVI